jgi:hypothetical protein
MKQTNPVIFIITRGIVIGVFLFFILHLYRLFMADEIALNSYLSNLEQKAVLLEGISMIFSGFFLAYYIRRQINNLKNHKQGD